MKRLDILLNKQITHSYLIFLQVKNLLFYLEIICMICGLSLLFFLPQCCDLGFHASLARTFRTYLSAEYNLETSRHEGLDIIENAVDNLDARSDKHTVMDMCNQVFCPPLKFDYQPHMGDEVCNQKWFMLLHNAPFLQM